MSRVRTACPSCQCLSITKRSRIGGYKCKSCKEEFEIPAITMYGARVRTDDSRKHITRDENGTILTRKACPKCGSVCIHTRTRTSDWKCRKCRVSFKEPAIKDVVALCKNSANRNSQYQREYQIRYRKTYCRNHKNPAMEAEYIARRL
ncbi:MAG: hypothetical protein GQ576_04800 [Methanococcoides sp.]|nr:hypothetical protein [Methanococcoides sp.]